MEEINQTPITNTPIIDPPQLLKTNYKTLFFLFLGLFLIILIILVLFLTKTNKPVISQPQTTGNIIIPSPTLIPTLITTLIPTQTAIIPTIDPTADWKTYIDPTYKYSINYPSTWIIDTKLANNTILSISSPEKIKSLKSPNNYEGYSGDDINIQFYKDYKNSLTKNKSIEEYLLDKTSFSNYSKTKIGSLDGYKATELGMAEYPNFYIINGNDIFIISSNIDFSKTELQILNTFKFN